MKVICLLSEIVAINFSHLLDATAYAWPVFKASCAADAPWTAATELKIHAEAHDEYLHSLLRKTLLEDTDKGASGKSRAVPQPNVQLELRSLVQRTLELRPRIKSLADMVYS